MIYNRCLNIPAVLTCDDDKRDNGMIGRGLARTSGANSNARNSNFKGQMESKIGEKSMVD